MEKEHLYLKILMLVWEVLLLLEVHLFIHVKRNVWIFKKEEILMSGIMFYIKLKKAF